MAKNEPKQLNQTYDRLIEVLDATDNALRVQDENGNPIEDNVNKIWLTSVKEQEDGTRKSVVQMKNLSDIDEYVSLNTVATEVANKVNDEIKGLNAQYEEIQNINKDIQDIWTELGSAVAKLTITPVTPTYHAVLFDRKDDLVINYKFKSIASGLPTGPGEVVWNVNGVDVKSEKIRQNTDDNPEDYNTFNYVNYAILGTNTIIATFTDSYQNTRTIVWTIETIKLGLLIDNFNKTALYQDTVVINFRVTGLGEDSSATVYFELDGQPIYNVSFASTDTTKQYRLAKQSHGAHLLKVYATTKLGIEDVSSNIEYLDIMFREEGNNTPIISWPYDPKSLVLEQYRNQDFNYSVFTPGQDVSEIKLTAKLRYINLNDGQEKVEEQFWELTSDWNKVVNDQFIERTMIWSYRPAPFMAADTTGSVELTIQSGGVIKTKTFTVAKSRVNINPVTSGLVLDFNPQGKSNQDKDAKDFFYEHPDHTTHMTVSSNFDWVNGGWQKDEEGNDIFLVKTGSRMYLDYPLFDNEAGVNDAKTTGKHFKLIYKATNCGSFDAQVMNCREYLGWRHEVQTEVYALNEDGEPELASISNDYYKNGYNAANNSTSLIWKDDIIGGELINQSAEKDERDANGVGILYVITASESYIGVNVNAQEAKLHSSFADLPIVYCEDEIIALSFDIEPQGDRQNLMTAYINADPSRVVQYPNATSFVQEDDPQIIEFGSDECDVYIYRFKVYNRNLKTTKTNIDTNEIFDDYIADSLSADKMLEEYTANNFLDVNGNIKIDELSNLCPDLRIILITCDRFTKDKNDKVKGCTVQHILKNGRPEDNWIATNVQVKGQGTSSNAYGSSARNIDIKLNKLEDAEGNELDYALTYTNADGQVVQAEKYGMTDESIPVNYFNIKVNVASSENANNACLADWYNTYDPYVRPARTGGVRDTMEFHPCVIFLRETNINDWQEFQPDSDGKEVYHFYACGDFGNSKKNHEVFGMGVQAELDIATAVADGQTEIEINNNIYPLSTPEEQKAAIKELQRKECVVEISNNTHPITLFKALDGLDDILPDGYDATSKTATDYIDLWTGDAIEFRYPEDLFEAATWEYTGDGKDDFEPDEIEEAQLTLAVLQPQVQRLWRWVQATDITTKTNRPLTEEEKFDDFTIDSVEYRQAKFIKEYTDYFVKDSLLFQYLFTDRYLMIDNRAKNMFLHTTDGLHWDFTMDYDNDTSLGCENSGYLLLDYNLEDCDEINGIPVYNGNDSVLWENVRTLLQDQLEATYNNDRCKEAWSANNLLGKMSNYQAYKPTLLQMLDMYRKYIRPYKTGHGPSTVSEPQYLERMNGRKTFQRKRFERYREIYIGSKYRAASFEDGSQDITIRINYNPGSVTVTPYCDMYPYFKWGNSRYPRERKDRARIKRGQPFTIVLDNQAIGAVPNQECHFCGATMLSDIGSLAEFKIAEGGFSKAVKLKKLILGDRTGKTVSTVSMTNVTLPDSPLLEEFDISYTRYNKPLDFSNQPMLKEVYTLGSQVSSVTFAPNGTLHTAKLNAINELTMNGLIQLKDFQMSYDLLNTINITNTPFLSSSVKFFQSLSGATSGEVSDINLTLPEAQAKLFDKFITQSGVEDEYKTKIKLSGYAKFILGYESDIIKYNTVWPSLETKAETLIPQYEVVFKNYDGSELIKYYVDEGSTSVPNAILALGDKLERPSTEQYTFTFANWNPNDFDQDGNYVGGPIYEDREYVAEYTSTVRKYSVTWEIDSLTPPADSDSKLTYQFIKEGLSYGADVEFANYNCNKYITINKEILFADFDQSFILEANKDKNFKDAYWPNTIKYDDDDKEWVIDFMRNKSTVFYRATSFYFTDLVNGNILEWKDNKTQEILTWLPVPAALGDDSGSRYTSVVENYKIRCYGMGDRTETIVDDYCRCVLDWEDKNIPVPFKINLVWERTSLNESIEHTQLFNENSLFKPQNDGKKYRLFNGWDKHTSYITEDNMLVQAKWEESKLPSKVTENTDFVNWNAATWYEFTEKNTAYEVEKQCPIGNRAVIEFKLPEYDNIGEYIDLVSEDKPLILNKECIIPSDENGQSYKLTNEDWTLLIDYKSKEKTTNTVMSAVNKQTSNIIISSNHTISVDNSPSTITEYNPLNDTFSRNVIIISHKKDSKSVELQWGNPWDTQTSTKTIKNRTQEFNHEIVFGGYYPPGSSALQEDGNSIIYKCRLYKNYFGQSLRNELSSVITNKLKFDISSHKPYTVGDANEYTKLVFICSGSLPEKLRMTTSYSSTHTFAPDSRLYSWLNNRFLRTMPISWQVLLLKPNIVHANVGNNKTYSSKTRLWLPSKKEIWYTESSDKKYDQEYTPSQSVYQQAAKGSSYSAFSVHKCVGSSQYTDDIAGSPEIYQEYGYGYKWSSEEPNPTDGYIWAKDASISIYNEKEQMWKPSSYFWLRSMKDNSFEAATVGIKASTSTLNPLNIVSQSGSGTYYGVVPCFAIGKE